MTQNILLNYPNYVVQMNDIATYDFTAEAITVTINFSDVENVSIYEMLEDILVANPTLIQLQTLNELKTVNAEVLVSEFQNFQYLVDSIGETITITITL